MTTKIPHAHIESREFREKGTGTPRDINLRIAKAQRTKYTNASHNRCCAQPMFTRSVCARVCVCSRVCVPRYWRIRLFVYFVCVFMCTHNSLVAFPISLPHFAMRALHFPFWLLHCRERLPSLLWQRCFSINAFKLHFDSPIIWYFYDS